MYITPPRGLGELLAAHPDAARCLVLHMYRYANGQREAREEDSLLKELLSRFAQDNYRIKPLLRQIALSEGFRRGRKASEEPPEKEGN